MTITSRPANAAYRAGHDRVFAKRKPCLQHTQDGAQWKPIKLLRLGVMETWLVCGMCEKVYQQIVALHGE